MKVWLRSVLDYFGAEGAQDAFEYVLVIGIVVVGALLAIGTPIGGAMIDGIVGGACDAIDFLDDSGPNNFFDGVCDPPAPAP